MVNPNIKTFRTFTRAVPALFNSVMFHNQIHNRFLQKKTTTKKTPAVKIYNMLVTTFKNIKEQKAA
jgi:hypothetical protein